MSITLNTFIELSPDEDYCKLYRICNYRYEICLYRVMFGVRVRLIDRQNPILDPYIVDWCVGDNSNMASYLIGGLKQFIVNGGDVQKLRAYVSPPVKPIDQSPQFLYEVCSLMGGPTPHPLPPRLKYGFDKLFYFEETKDSN